MLLILIDTFCLRSVWYPKIKHVYEFVVMIISRMVYASFKSLLAKGFRYTSYKGVYWKPCLPKMQKTYFNYISNIVALLWILAIWFASSDNSLHLKWTPLSIVTNVAPLWSSGHCVKNPKLLHINLLLFNEIYIYANMSLHISNKRLFFKCIQV